MIRCLEHTACNPGIFESSCAYSYSMLADKQLGFCGDIHVQGAARGSVQASLIISRYRIR